MHDKDACTFFILKANLQRGEQNGGGEEPDH